MKRAIACTATVIAASLLSTAAFATTGTSNETGEATATATYTVKSPFGFNITLTDSSGNGKVTEGETLITGSLKSDQDGVYSVTSYGNRHGIMGSSFSLGAAMKNGSEEYADTLEVYAGDKVLTADTNLAKGEVALALKATKSYTLEPGVYNVSLTISGKSK